MFTHLHEQIRGAREAHGLSQQKLADLAGVDRSDIQRLERGDNVTIKLLSKVLQQLPNLRNISIGNVNVVVDSLTIDIHSLRQLTVDMITTGTQILRLLDQAPPAKPLNEGPVGATRVPIPTDINPTLKERLRRLDPTDLGRRPDPKDPSWKTVIAPAPSEEDVRRAEEPVKQPGNEQFRADE